MGGIKKAHLDAIHNKLRIQDNRIADLERVIGQLIKVPTSIKTMDERSYMQNNYDEKSNNEVITLTDDMERVSDVIQQLSSKTTVKEFIESFGNFEKRQVSILCNVIENIWDIKYIKEVYEEVKIRDLKMQRNIGEKTTKIINWIYENENKYKFI